MKRLLIIQILLLSNIIISNSFEKEISEDLHYLSRGDEIVTLSKGPSNSYLVIQFYNCENIRIDFNIAIDGKEYDYSFIEDVKFLYIPIKNGENSPKLHLKSNNEKLLRYSYSKANLFSFSPVLKKTIRLSQSNLNLYFSFQNFAKGVEAEYLILMVKNIDKIQLDKLRNRCYLYKIMHGESNEQFLLYQFKTKSELANIEIKYEMDSKIYESFQNLGIIVLGKETSNFKTEIIYDPIYYEKKVEKKEEYVKKNSFTIKLLPYCLFALFIIFIYVIRYIFKRMSYKKPIPMKDSEIYLKI